MLRMATNTPTQKVLVGGLAGAITTILVFVFTTYVDPGTKFPDAVVAALTTILAFIVSYLVPPSPRDVIVHEPDAQTGS